MEMDEGARKWLYRTAHQNLWRVQSFYEWDDLVQDGIMWYYIIVRRYCYRPRRRSHVMALFKTSFHNYLHDMAKKKQRHLAFDEAISIYVDQAEKRLVLDVSDNSTGADEMEFAVTLSRAPVELKQRLARCAEGEMKNPVAARYAASQLKWLLTA